MRRHHERFIKFAGILTVLVVVLAIAGFALTNEASVEEVRELVVAGSASQALSQVEGVLRDQPDDVEALFLQGVSLADLGRIDEAEASFLRALELDPGQPEPYNNLAVIYAQTGRYQKAVDALRQALATHPAYNASYENLSKIYGRLASDAYTRALGVEAEAPRPVMDLALLRETSSAAIPIESSATMTEASPAPAEPMVSESEPAAPMMAEEMAEDPVAILDEEVAEEIEEIAEVATEPVPAKPLVQMMPEETPEAEQPVAAPDSTIDTEIAEAVPEPVAEEPAVETGVSPEEAEQGSRSGELAKAVEAWAAAWSEQRIGGYLGAYASTFVPPHGLNRSAWEAQRQERLAAPEYVQVSIAFLDANVNADGVGRIRFIQGYESDRFSDSVTKSLEMIEEGGEWRIVGEIVED